jgi:hypothetical protein
MKRHLVDALTGRQRRVSPSSAARLRPAGSGRGPRRIAAKEDARQRVRDDPVSQSKLSYLPHVKEYEGSFVALVRGHAERGSGSRNRAAHGEDLECQVIDAHAASRIRELESFAGALDPQATRVTTPMTFEGPETRPRRCSLRRGRPGRVGCNSKAAHHGRSQTVSRDEALSPGNHNVPHTRSSIHPRPIALHRCAGVADVLEEGESHPLVRRPGSAPPLPDAELSERPRRQPVSSERVEEESWCGGRSRRRESDDCIRHAL